MIAGYYRAKRSWFRNNNRKATNLLVEVQKHLTITRIYEDATCLECEEEEDSHLAQYPTRGRMKCATFGAVELNKQEEKGHSLGRKQDSEVQ